MKTISLYLVILGLITPAWAEAPYTISISGKALPGKVTNESFLVDESTELKIQSSSTIRGENASEAVRAYFYDPLGRKIDYFAVAQTEGVKAEKPFFKKAPDPLDFLHIKKPPAGKWKLEVDASTVTKEVPYTFTISLKDTAYRFTAISGFGEGKPGIEAPLIAKVTKNGDPVLGVNLSAEIEADKPFGLPAIATTKLRFRDDGASGDENAGDGVYTALFTPEQPSRHIVCVRATDEKIFERKECQAMYVSMRGVEFMGVKNEQALDKDGDGKYDSLDLTVQIRVTDEMSRYLLSVYLTDREGRPVEAITRGGTGDEQVQGAEPGTEVDIPRKIGLHEIVLSFPGSEIQGSKTDGPYFLKYSCEDSAIFGTSLYGKRNAYETKTYSWKNFE